MELTSPAFPNRGTIGLEYSAFGAGRFPPLHISGVPAEAAALVLIMDDPDVPIERIPSGVFDHWVVWNVPPDTATITDPAATSGATGRTTRGTHEYVAPAAPPGTGRHRYSFRLYAIDAPLDLNAEAGRADVLAAMAGRVLAEAELLGYFEGPAKQ